jgi:hypothetical protein
MSVPIDGVRLDWPEQPAQPAVPAPATEAPAEIAEPGPSPFERLLRAVGARIEEGERIVADAKSGYRSLDAAELIALQAGIYRYSEAIDLSAKLVDRATSAVRTVLSGGQ